MAKKVLVTWSRPRYKVDICIRSRQNSIEQYLGLLDQGAVRENSFSFEISVNFFVFKVIVQTAFGRSHGFKNVGNRCGKKAFCGKLAQGFVNNFLFQCHGVIALLLGAKRMKTDRSVWFIEFSTSL